MPLPMQVFALLRERGLLAPGALVVYEHAARTILPEIPGYRSVREEVYGDVALAFLRIAIAELTNGKPSRVTRAIYPGSFDPPTCGHLDVIERAAKCFGELVVAIVVNPQKRQPMFSLDERVEMLKECIAPIRNARVEHFRGLAGRLRQGCAGRRHRQRVAGRFRFRERNVGGVDEPLALRSRYVLLDVRSEVLVRQLQFGQRGLLSRRRRGVARARTGSPAHDGQTRRVTRISFLSGGIHVGLSRAGQTRGLRARRDVAPSGLPRPIRRAPHRAGRERFARRCRSKSAARKIIAKDQDRVLRAAQEKAQAIVDEAASKHEELVDQNEIVQRARTTAEVVLREAEAAARKIRDGADHYAAQVLADMEGRLSSAIGSVRKGRESLARSSASAGAASGSSEPLADAAAKSKRAAFDSQVAGDETAALESVEA